MRVPVQAILVMLVLALLIAVMGCERGRRGLRGVQGAPGVGCSVEPVANGALIQCGGNTEAVIYNGTNGEDGEDGQDLVPGPYSVVEVINPCGDQPGVDEVLLRLENGQLLAHYAGGGNIQFLGLIGPGSYVTTDGKNCHFTVDANYNVSY